MRGAAAAEPLPAQAEFGKARANRLDFSREKDRRIATVREGSAEQRTYDIAYVLGKRTMEQPLVSMDKGRIQALPVAFDPSAREWFDIFAGEERVAGEFGHWTGRGMNANSQCIECHATGYGKGYEAVTDTYMSSWSEMGVGCESCHGPGAAHVENPAAPYGPFGKTSGIAKFRPMPAASPAAELTESDSSGPFETSIAARPLAATAMHDLCATCHSVRRPIAEGFVPGAAFLDHFEPVMLDEDLYWSDGSVREEAYESTSFAQSRMHAAGVNCVACHEVHTGELRASGDDLCLSCHEPKFAEKNHTAHESETVGARCVSCHMPESVFMARDRRRDHALAVPDPILAKQVGVPSACETCHADRGRDTLSADAERLWPSLTGARFARRRAVAEAFHASRRGKPETLGTLLACLAGGVCNTTILRASAARLTARLPVSMQLEGALLEALEDPEPLVRSAAAFALADFDAREPMRRQSLSAAAGDPVKAVRLNAAWALRHVETDRLPKEQSEPLERVFNEWRASAMLLADAPETWHTLGVFETARDDLNAAEAAYRKAVAMEPRATPSRHNLAMLHVSAGRIAEAQKEFEALVAIDASSAAAWCALGAVHSEQKSWQQAARALSKCLKIDPAYPGALVDLTNAYLEAGIPNVARTVLAGAVSLPASRREALIGLVLVELRSGTRDDARRAARILVAEDPTAAEDPEVARLLAESAGTQSTEREVETGPATGEGTGAVSKSP